MIAPLYHGICWYPELWGEDVWREDIDAMRELQINLVRMGDFIWSAVEPEPGHFDFSLLLRAADVLHAAGIRFILTTGTAAAPVWLTDGHPERCHVNERGVMRHGSRLHVCVNNPDFQAAIVKMLAEYAKALGSHPGLVMWQIDNEINSQVSSCLCETCKHKWHDWLKARYGDIQALNEAWTAAIFSQTYHAFAQVPQPLPTPFLHNPSLLTDYIRFTMDSAAAYTQVQADVLRRHSDAPVTTDGSIGFCLDHSALFQKLDVATFTTYASQEHHSIYLMNHDFWRNIRPGQKHWLVETACLHAGHSNNIARPLPKGYLAAEAAAGFALDSQSFCYWHMRQHRGGCEIGHSALLSAWGAKTAGWREVEQAAEVKTMLEPLILRTRLVKPQVALFYSDIARAFFETEKLPQGSYTGWVRLLHRLIFQAGYARDVITESAAWNDYRLVWTPFLPYMDAETLDMAEVFVRNGGIWICGPMTGYRTAEHGVPTDCALGEIERRFGFSTKFVAPLYDCVADVDGYAEHPDLAMWGFAFAERGIQPLGRIRNGCMDSEVFFAEMPAGRGTLVLLGATPAGESGEALLSRIAEKYIARSGVTRNAIPSEGVEIIERENEFGKAMIAVNMDKIPGTAGLNGRTVTLQPYETKILEDNTEGFKR
ncbi:MAG: beta-galactosidase [Bacillota bacterium]